MRVVFVTDRIGSLSSARAGEALATGWSRRRPHDQLAVVPVGAAGAGLVEAYADLVGADVDLAPGRALGTDDGAERGLHGGPVAEVSDDVVLLMAVAGAETVLVGVDGPDPVPTPADRRATSAAWGEAIARAVRPAPDGSPVRTLAVDLGGCMARDAGAGLLARLGAVADVPLDRGAEALSQVSRIDLGPVRHLLAGVDDLVAVVPADQADRVLLGMQGITSLHGASLREAGLPWDPADLLRADATLQRFSALLAPDLADGPGLGACGGAAYALAALGARVVTGPQWLAEQAGLADTISLADLVVTGAGAYDFANRGGESVEAVVRLADRAMRPAVAVAGLVTISSREMRTQGLEAAYALSDAVPGTTVHVTVEDLVAMGERLARTWAS